MQTTVTIRGQIVIPAKLRVKYNLKPGMRLEWMDEGEVMVVMPIPNDPIKELKGMFKGEKLREALLRSRREDRERA